MPNDIYGAIFDIKELPKLITMVKEFYAARPQASQTAGHQLLQLTPFQLYLNNCRLYKDFSYKPYLRDWLFLKSFMHISKVIGNPTEVESLTNPLSPEEEVEVDLHFLATSMAIEEVMETTLIGDREVDLEVNNRGRGGQIFDKSPTTKKSKVNSKTPNKDFKGRCYTCHEYGHISTNCPQNPRARHRNNGGNNQYN